MHTYIVTNIVGGGTCEELIGSKLASCKSVPIVRDTAGGFLTSG